MGDWTTGRGYVSEPSRYVSQAQIAREVYEAEQRQKRDEKKKVRRIKSKDETYSSYRLTPQMERIKSEVERIQREIKAWDETVPRNRHERRKRDAILRDLRHELDRLPNRA